MGRTIKVLDVRLDSYGSFLGMEKGCIVLRDKHGNTEKYPLFENEIGEVILKSGNCVSTGVLSALGFWGIDVLVTTRAGRPIAVLKNLEDDSHVKTRISQYEALNNGKGINVAKKIVLAKIESENQVLKKHGLRQHDIMGAREAVRRLEAEDLRSMRKRLLSLEGKYGNRYFSQIFLLFPKEIRPKARRTRHAYDATNNLFNLCYDFLFWKCYRALIKAHLETHLGFLHSIKYQRPSLVCDFEELYRYLVDDFLIEYSQDLKPRDFRAKTQTFNGKKGKRIYLKEKKSRELTANLLDYFKRKVRVPRIRLGKSQEIETLINEEALLLAKYLRNERKGWTPRIALPLGEG